MKNSLFNYMIAFFAVLISVSLGILTGIDEVRNGIILSFIIHWLLFIPAFIFKTEKFYDLTGTISYISIVLYVLLSTSNGISNFGNIIVSSLIIIWTLRLGTFLFIRIKKAGEDKRFREIKKSFSWFLMAFTVSGMWVSICTICALTGISNGIELTMVTYIGIIIFIVGFAVEIISDNQKTNFRKIEGNKDKFITTGLWKYSRHPNYLGEIGFWFGIYFMGISSGLAPLWIILCPLSMLALFVFASCPMMDNRSLENRSDYKEYMEKTSQLLLLPPKN